MKKRLRKKLMLGEFQSKQGWISCLFHSELPEKRVDEIKEEVSALANSFGLFTFRASDSAGCTWLLESSKRYQSVTEEQRTDLVSLLHTISEVASVEDGGPGRAW